jgi:hypothetical protein
MRRMTHSLNCGLVSVPTERLVLPKGLLVCLAVSAELDGGRRTQPPHICAQCVPVSAMFDQ